MSVIGSTCELAGLLDSLCVPCPRKGEKCFYAVLELCDCVGSLGGLGCSDSVLILMPWGLQAINLLCLHWMDITRPVHAVRLWVTPFFQPVFIFSVAGFWTKRSPQTGLGGFRLHGVHRSVARVPRHGAEEAWTWKFASSRLGSAVDVAVKQGLRHTYKVRLESPKSVLYFSGAAAEFPHCLRHFWAAPALRLRGLTGSG